MKVQYASDLHLEFYDNSVFLARGPMKVVGDVLVIAGDTLPLWDFDSYKQHRFFDWCADNYKQTFLVPGNHEYYKDDIAKYPESWRLELRKNVVMYENACVRVDDTDFILSTMWSHIPMSMWLTLKKGMSDFTLIKYNGKPLTATPEWHPIKLDMWHTASTGKTSPETGPWIWMRPLKRFPGKRRLSFCQTGIAEVTIWSNPARTVRGTN